MDAVGPTDRRLWLRGPRLLIVGYFVVLVVIVAATVPALVTTLDTLNRQQATYDKANAAVSELLVSALNQETGVRGYVLTGDPSFLQPYDLGSAQYARAMSQLRRIELGTPFRDEVSVAASSFQRWHAMASTAITDVQHHNSPAALGTSVQAGAKDYFDAFRRDQSALASSVEQDLRASRQSLHRQVEFALLVLILAATVGTLIGLGMWLWWRLWGRQAAERDAELANRAVLMQSAIDATSDSLYAKDLTGRHILANRARAAAVSGGDADADLIGHTIDEFVDAEVAADIRRNEELVLRTGEGRRFEEVLPQPDGPHVFSMVKSPLRDFRGEITGIVGTARDVTAEMALLADRERLYQLEHRLAETLQLSMLGTDRIDDARIEVCARYRPAADDMAVGGDWYDVVPAPDSRVALIVGDAVGHGIDAATAMGQLRSALAALAYAGLNPGTALEALDRFAADLPRARSATCLVALIDPVRREIEYSCAGHMPPVVARPGGRPERLDLAQDPPLAVPRSRPRRTTTVPFPPGSVIVLYTDGLVERRNELIDIGLERLETLIENLVGPSMDELCDKVIGDLGVDQRQRDDIAVISARLAHSSTLGTHNS